MKYTLNFTRRAARNYGFTIVELVIVVVVIAVLATLSVVGYNGIRNQAIDTSLKSDLKTASDTLNVDRTRTGSFPSNAAAANNGAGLKSSGENTLTYNVSGNEYCISATSTLINKTYYYQNTTRETLEGDCPVMTLDGWKEIAAANDYSCAISSDNLIYCWGMGSLTPTLLGQGAIPAGATLSGITAGSGHFCVVGNGSAYCWGDNTNGRLGDGTTTNRTTPVAVVQGAMPGGATVSTIYAGGNSSCLLITTGAVYCWGYGASGTLGRGSTTSSSTPVAVVQGAIPGGVTAQSLSVGGNNGCIIGSNNRAYCWGEGSNGALGNGSNSQNNSPVAVSQGALPAGYALASIDVGANHSCVVATTGLGYCWGLGSSGRLGHGSATTSTTPVAVSGGTSYETIYAGSSLTCGVSTGTTSYCWGYNSTGQLGNGGTSSWFIPDAVEQGAIPGGVTLESISPALSHTCAVASNNKAYCWGDNTGGKLGTGNTTQTTVPTEVNLTP